MAINVINHRRIAEIVATSAWQRASQRFRAAQDSYTISKGARRLGWPGRGRDAATARSILRGLCGCSFATMTPLALCLTTQLLTVDGQALAAGVAELAAKYNVVAGIMRAGLCGASKFREAGVQLPR